MEQNPYRSSGYAPSAELPQAKVRTPAICLIVVGAISIAFSILSVIMDIFLLASGMAEELSLRTGNDEVGYAMFRLTWAVVLLLTSTLVTIGGISMLRMRSYALSYTAAVVASIPCLGPCCILGIPFGIWALVVLHREDVRSAFRK